MRAKLAAVVAGSVAVPLALLSTLALRGEVPLRLLVACGVALGAYVATDRLIPAVQSLTLAAGLSGKDLCKRGTAHADKQMCAPRGRRPPEGVVALSHALPLARAAPAALSRSASCRAPCTSWP